MATDKSFPSRSSVQTREVPRHCATLRRSKRLPRIQQIIRSESTRSACEVCFNLRKDSTQENDALCGTLLILITPGRVEEWRLAPEVRSISCSPFPLGVPHESDRKLVSIPRHVERSMQISRTPLSCSLRKKIYGT